MAPWTDVQHAIDAGPTNGSAGPAGPHRRRCTVRALTGKGAALFGYASLHRPVDDLMPLVSDPSDPLGVLNLRTHRLPLAQAPGAYAMFQRKEEGCIKVVLDPEA